MRILQRLGTLLLGLPIPVFCEHSPLYVSSHREQPPLQGGVGARPPLLPSPPRLGPPPDGPAVKGHASRWRRERKRQATNANDPSSLGQAPVALQNATVVSTETITLTVTSFTGAPETTVVVVTETEVLTFVDPAQQTQTLTSTAAVLFSRARRTLRNAPPTLSPGTPALVHTPTVPGTPNPILARDNGPAFAKSSAPSDFPRRLRPGKRDDAGLVSRVTSTSTVFARSVVVEMVTNTVFSAVTVAPNAVTTVVVTTTVFVTQGPSTSSTRGSISGTSFTSSTNLFASPSRSATNSSLLTSSALTSSSLTEIPLTTSQTGTATIPTTTATAIPAPAIASSSLPSGQIAGIVLGGIVILFLLFLAAYFARRIVQKRRSVRAQQRQQLTPPEEAANPNSKLNPVIGPNKRGNGTGSAAVARVRWASPPTVPPSASVGAAVHNNNDNNNNMPEDATGREGEVRIVIRPAPKRRTQSSQLWPFSPGHFERSGGGQNQAQAQGQGRDFYFTKEAGVLSASPAATGTGMTTPDPAAWSIDSERGSLQE
ncbi:hypothetical protein N656DRAFT_799572 [Canariomyces notabilis]|uniref:Mid2 domain-containing protein n=1 Tax=Canariomyces notabilis TaxID=2074819 RepID=A0AAN6QME7_9PEZI|nr:hypothetical protein N656DRAFT_799572 [Canariomyces arenarius]